MTTVAEALTNRLAVLRQSIIRLVSGVGKRQDHTACLMSAARIMSGQAGADDIRDDACNGVAREVRTLAIRVNDWNGWASDDERTEFLMPIVPLLLDTVGSREVSVRRAFLCADVAVRVIAPISLDARGFAADAARLRNLAPIVNRESAEMARIESHKAAAYAADAYAAAYAATAAAAYAAYADAAAADAAAADAYAAAYAAYADAAAAAADADADADAKKTSRIAIRDALVKLLIDMCAIRDEKPVQP